MNDHDETDPMSFVSQLDATMEAVETQCPWCKVDVEVIPAGGTRWVIGFSHQPGCPDEVVEQVVEQVEPWTVE